MLDGDVESLFTPNEFRKIMSNQTDKLTFEMAVRLVNRYYDNKKGILNIPNLGPLPPKQDRQTYSATGQKLVNVV